MISADVIYFGSMERLDTRNIYGGCFFIMSKSYKTVFGLLKPSWFYSVHSAFVIQFGYPSLHNTQKFFHSLKYLADVIEFVILDQINKMASSFSE